MTRYVALLRGVNVGGKKVKMDALRALLVSLGHEDAVTYVQSGNVVFSAPKTAEAKLAGALARAIEAEFGFPVPVLVRTEAQLGTVLDANPFLSSGNGSSVDPAHLHVTFLAEKPAKVAVGAIPEDGRSGPDEMRLVGREVYLHCPKGYGTTKLNNTFFEKKLRVTATTRNWRTVGNLFELAQG